MENVKPSNVEEFEGAIRKKTTELIAPDGKQLLRSKALEAIKSLKHIADALADAVIKQASEEVEKAKEEVEKANKELEELKNLKG